MNEIKITPYCKDNGHKCLDDGVCVYCNDKHGLNRIMVNKIVNEVLKAKNKYFDYAHFDSSNMADFTLMSTTISDLVSVYPIDEVEAGEIISQLTH